MIQKLMQGMGIGLAASAVALLLWAAGWLQWWEARTWDWRVAFLSRPGPATDQIRLILLDQKSLDWGKEENGLSWPWPREVYSCIVTFCKRSGARTVAFDVLYSEPSAYGVKDDQILGEAIASCPGFVSSVFLGTSTGSTTTWPADVPVLSLHVKGLDEWLSINGAAGIVMPRATFPIPEVATNAAMLANVHADPDPDGIYRRVRLFNIFDGKFVPSLGLAAFLAASPGETIEIKPGRIKIGSRTIPFDKNGYAILRYRGPSGTHSRLSAASIIQSELRIRQGEDPVIKVPEALKDRHVFFGLSAPGLYDMRPTPISGVYPGIEIYATMLDNILSGDFIKEAPGTVTVILTAVLALIGGVLASFTRSALGSLLAFLISLPVPVLLCIAAYEKGIWLPLVVQEIAVAQALVAGIVLNYATEGRQKRFIKSAFKQYLSPAVIEQLIQHPERLKLGGERRQLSIFFSDLRGFTGISENLDPQDLTTLLNDYLSAMTDILQEEGGTVDKYSGDAIIAFWNAPLEQPDHAERSVRAALRCQAKLAELRPDFLARIRVDLFMRIGLHTGTVVVGNMGSRTRFNYTILGDAANLASRLEGLNKEFGTSIIISDATCQHIGKAFGIREISCVQVVGRKEPVRIFEPMSWEEFEARQADLSAFAHGLEAYYTGEFQKALQIFKQIEKKDPVAAAYARKCQLLLKDPPLQWRGVWVMTEK